MTEETRPPTVEERYTNAAHTTSLAVNPDRRGAADYLMAAGWSESRLGAALMRLRSEWDGAQKPRAVSREAVDAAVTFAMGKGVPSQDDYRQARRQHAEWLLHEQKILMGQLKSLPEVRAALVETVARRGYENAEDLAMGTLMWWLDPTCRVCHGRKFEAVKDTGRLSGRLCPACRGSGLRLRDLGIESAVIVGLLDDFVYRARQSMSKKLRQFPHHPEKKA